MNISFKKYCTSFNKYLELLFIKLSPKRIAFIAIILGIALRLIHYLLDRSLWIDEAFVA